MSSSHRAPAARALIAEGVTDDRDQIRLWARARDRAPHAARRAAGSGRSAASTSSPPSSARMRCRPRRRATGRLYRQRLRRDAARDPRASGSPKRSTPSARASPSRPKRSRASSPLRAGMASGSSFTPISSRICRRRARRGIRRALGRSSGIHRRGRRRGDGKSRHRRGAAARRLLLHPRDASRRPSRPSPHMACRWRSPPTAIPAPRR